jgi:hypothetical protein
MVRPFHGASLVNYLEFDGALCRQICRAATPFFRSAAQSVAISIPQKRFSIGS